MKFFRKLKNIIDLNSMKLKLGFISFLFVCFITFIVGFVILLLFQKNIEQIIYSEIEEKWRDVFSTFIVGEDGSLVMLRKPSDYKYDNQNSGSYWQIRIEKDNKLIKSKSLGLDTIRDDISDFYGIAILNDSYFGNRVYSLSKSIYLSQLNGNYKGRDRAIISVAIDGYSIDNLMASFSRDMSLSLLVISSAIIAVFLLMINFTVSPLKKLESDINDLNSRKISRLNKFYVSELKSLVESINNLLEKQDQSVDKARNRAGALAHGIKTPLTILSLDVKKIEQFNPELACLLKEQIDNIQKHVSRELVRARIRGGIDILKSLGENSILDANKSVRKIVSAMEKMPFSENISYIIDVNNIQKIAIDKNDFNEIMGNLIENSRKWAKSFVKIKIYNIDSKTVTEVIDDGPGFIKTENEKNADGTGLGLSIVNDILEEYNSKLVVERIDNNTVVSFLIPKI